MESGVIFDKRISASSERAGEDHAAIQGRLKNHRSWSAPNNANQWLQIDLIGQYIVTRVATQGSAHRDHWVKKYELQYGDDENNFQSYRTQGQNAAKVKLGPFQTPLHSCAEPNW